MRAGGVGGLGPTKGVGDTLPSVAILGSLTEGPRPHFSVSRRRVAPELCLCSAPPAAVVGGNDGDQVGVTVSL